MHPVATAVTLLLCAPPFELVGTPGPGCSLTVQVAVSPAIQPLLDIGKLQIGCGFEPNITPLPPASVLEYTEPEAYVTVCCSLLDSAGKALPLASLTICIPGTCPASPCLADSDCADGNYCTTDACIDGECTNIKLDGFCCDCDVAAKPGQSVADQCDDGEFCTIASCDCDEHQCVYTEKTLPSGEECCETGDHPACADADYCTLDFCVANSCKNVPPLTTPACCETKADCSFEAPPPCKTWECLPAGCHARYVPQCAVWGAPCEAHSDCANDADPATVPFCVAPALGGYCRPVPAWVME